MESEKIAKSKVKDLIKGVPSQGQAEIRLMNPKKSGTITVRGYTDKNSGEFRPFVDEHGNPRVQRITKKILLDLTNVRDRLFYEQVRLHPIYTNSATPVLKLVNKEQDAIDFVTAKDLEAKANGIIQELDSKGLKDFSRVLLIPVREGSSDSALKSKLYEKAEENPLEVVNEWENPTREIKALLQEGLEKELFTKTGGVYRFKDQVMGTSHDLAVEWLLENDDLHPNMRKEMKK